ncbi:gametocyte-specific factor 1-like [Hyla sarda]|uniref:gametocyte-specific factor 1-like n=1 Tax=Hyla sarda TaxID=327740 RepID=UPI0024C3A845|nr:gametocyte-specific factor 1-like [Hyla sarda]XP_056409815.1 gametocyte-specific factor 1-like [Hyla sarda]XP_056409816.1 gametocyte-specific factor 1-like [Hyla sarda]
MAGICPYNGDHQVCGTERSTHLMGCQSKVVIGKAAGLSRWKTKWMEPKREEEEKLRQQEPNVQPFDPLDPDGLLQCPYDSNHQIRASRFPYHLLKCRKNHGELAIKLVTCPFNARHILPREDLSFHISRCDDRRCIEPDIGDEKPMYQVGSTLSRCNAPPCEEDWDKEMERGDASCVSGAASCHGAFPVHLMEPNDSLGFHLRAPKSVPYVLPWKMNNQA